MFFTTTLLIAGLLGLWAGTELVLKGATRIAEHYKLSHLFIGLTILAIGTDLPELMVAISSALDIRKGAEISGLVIGNSLGSCFCQLSLVLGIILFTGSLKSEKKFLWFNSTFLVGSIFLLLFFALDRAINATEGAMLLVCFFSYYAILIRKGEVALVPATAKDDFFKKNLFVLLGGFVLVILSSELVVSGAMQLASTWGVRHSFVGIVLVALGTSLPELAVSLNASLKGESGFSLGNIIGSNIFDTTVPIGVAAVIASLKVEPGILHFDLPMLLLLSIVVVYMLAKRFELNWKNGVFLIALYLLYMGLKVSGA